MFYFLKMEQHYRKYQQLKKKFCDERKVIYIT